MDGRQVIAEMRELMAEIEAGSHGISMDELRRIGKVKLDSWMRDTVDALFRGYRARERAISRGGTDRGVLCEYKRINTAIDDAIEAACFGYGEQVVSALRGNFFDGYGWRRSETSAYIAERTFYRIKKRCYLYVAVKLLMI